MDFLNYKNKYSYLLIFFSLIVIFLFFGDIDHYYSRVNLSQYNHSLWTWLYGFDQALASLKINPITGLGIGSTGYFEFFSDRLNVLFLHGNVYSNRYDTYSGFFRLIVEIGLPLTLIICSFLLKKIIFNNIYNKIFIIKSIQLYKNIIFFRYFSSIMIIGCLLKEPTYSRSVLFVSFLFFIYTFCTKNPDEL